MQNIQSNMAANEDDIIERLRQTLGIHKVEPITFSNRQLLMLKCQIVGDLEMGYAKLRKRIYQARKPKFWSDLEPEERLVLRVIRDHYDVNGDTESVLKFLTPKEAKISVVA